MKTLTKTSRNALRRVKHIILITGLCFLGLGVVAGFVAGALVQ